MRKRTSQMKTSSSSSLCLLEKGSSRRAHNPEVAGSNPAQATNNLNNRGDSMDKSRPQYGDLVRTTPEGKRIILERQLPWGLLQHLKKEYIQKGLKKEELKITYSYGIAH